ncbi:MAG: 5-methylcytosine-specific restriction enzyme B [candidate division BRC1 bacterium ADurb.Bin183]|nr:MAG: 5-methylcytosine-specific restriction enzyme B [candidate division BRC1 bacterium ADurb.Bin183]
MGKKDIVHLKDFFQKITINVHEIKKDKEVEVEYIFNNEKYTVVPLYYWEEPTYDANQKKKIKQIALNLDEHDWPTKSDNTGEIVKEYASLLKQKDKEKDFKEFLENVGEKIRSALEDGMGGQYWPTILNNNHWHDVIIMIKNILENPDKYKKLYDDEKLIHEEPVNKLIYEWLPEIKRKGRYRRKAFHGHYEMIKNLIRNALKYKNNNIKENTNMDYGESLFQTILYGPPGTGKTHEAKERARKAVEENFWKDKNQTEKQEEFFIQFIQFHPSFDYVDFIEGLKPTMINGQVTFELKNGIFKDFCRKAGVIERAIFPNKIKDDYWHKSVSESDIDALCKGLSSETSEYWKQWLSENKSKKTPVLPKFVFIIDEINRADLSKVFGELMYCLEPDYRGVEGKVKTQYCRLNSDETCFIKKDDDWFFIPTNVLILGTMNEIDRSVEFFDFALRRRFVWEEMNANDDMKKVLESMLKETNIRHKCDDLTNGAKEFNEKVISNEFKLSRQYHIGPTYFGKIRDYCSNEDDYAQGLKSLFEKHIEPLLREYARGTNLEDEIIEKSQDEFKSIFKID